MESTADAPSPPTVGTENEIRRRRISWRILMAALALPAFVIGTVMVLLVLRFLLGRSDDNIALASSAVLIAVVTAAVTLGRLGPHRGWNTRLKLRAGWGLFSLSVLALTLLGMQTIHKVTRSSRELVMYSYIRQFQAAAGQLFLEIPYRIFVTHDDLVGPERYIKAVNSVAGEDYGQMFPLRRDQTDVLYYNSFVLPDGRKIESPNGNKEPLKPDGIDVLSLPEGGRFETTYHGGMADGPFRAYRADNRLWGEATYAKGRLTGPSWIYLQDGSRFDELDITQRPETIAGARLAARDFTGAIKEFNRALELQPDETGLLQGRAETLEAMGNLPGALMDLQQARTGWEKWGMTDEVKRLDQKIARLRQMLDAAPRIMP